MRVSGISLEFAFDFKVWSDPAWIRDYGTGTVQVFDSDISFSIDLTNKDGKLSVGYSDARIHTRDYDIILHGQNDISRAVQLMLTNFKVFFEEELTSMLSSRLLKITEDFFNDRVLRSGDERLNMSLLMNPLFHQHYISFVIDGTYDG